MQKVLRRTHLAKGQARRKAEQQKKSKAINLYRYAKRQQKHLNAETRGAVRAARNVQREDWTLGVLAPKRDVGDDADKYGTVSVRRIQPPPEKGDGWWKDYCIVEGDRVVIVEPGHRDRGKIGTVADVKKEAEYCVVQGLNEVDVAVPDYMLVNEPDKTPRRTVEAPLPLSSVNLVYPLPNPTTGELRDVIITQLRRGKVRDPKEPPKRYIADYEPAFSVPYPEEEEPEYKDHDCDTYRIEVEKRTWVPTLIRPPMPPSIIDELRNKYSKFRDRHDEDFILKKKQEDEAAERKKMELKQLMRSPTQQLFKRERNRKKKVGRKVKLDEDALSIIGQHMAKHRGLPLPQLVEASKGTTSGLTSATPSRATSSAIRSTLSIPPPTSIPLNARSFYSSSRSSVLVAQRIVKRNLSTMTSWTSQPGFTVVNSILASDMASSFSYRWTAPLANNDFHILSTTKSDTTVKTHLHEANIGNARASSRKVVNGDAVKGSESLSLPIKSSHAATSEQTVPTPYESARNAESSPVPTIKKIQTYGRVEILKIPSEPIPIRKIRHQFIPIQKYPHGPSPVRKYNQDKPILFRKFGHTSVKPVEEAQVFHLHHNEEKAAKMIESQNRKLEQKSEEDVMAERNDVEGLMKSIERKKWEDLMELPYGPLTRKEARKSRKLENKLIA